MSADEELGGVVLTCMIALVLTEILRRILLLGSQALRKSRHASDSSECDQDSHIGILLFPRWHIILLQTQFLGLSQAAGYAMGSQCAGYVALGVLLFLALISGLVFSAYVLYEGIEHSSMVSFEHCNKTGFLQGIKMVASAKENGGGLVASVKEKKRVFDEVLQQFLSSCHLP